MSGSYLRIFACKGFEEDLFIVPRTQLFTDSLFYPVRAFSFTLVLISNECTSFKKKNPKVLYFLV